MRQKDYHLLHRHKHQGLGLFHEDFEDESAHDQQLLALAAKVNVNASPECDAIFPFQFPAVLTETKARKLSYQKIVQLTAWNSAQRFGLNNKGAIAVGYDADIALVDPNASYVVKADESLSEQEYTPFEGFTINAKVTDT